MQKIIPCLWFDDQAEEAAAFYASLFENTSIGYKARYGKDGFEIHGQPETRNRNTNYDRKKVWRNYIFR